MTTQTATFAEIDAFLAAHPDTAEDDLGLLPPDDEEEGWNAAQYIGETSDEMTAFLRDHGLSTTADSVTFDLDQFPAINAALEEIGEAYDSADDAAREETFRRFGITSDDSYDYNHGYVASFLEILAAYARHIA